jgi:hypothetical protein
MKLRVISPKRLETIGRRLACASFLSCLFVLIPGGILIEHHTTAHAEILVSTLYGLDLAKVTLSVKTEDKYHERLRTRIVSRLAAKNLSINTTRVFKQGDPSLQVTLDWEQIDDPGVKRGLYYRNIELSESVVTERVPHVRAWTSTASVGLQEPIVSDRPTIEQLERDLDWLLDEFIKVYLDANGKRE